MPFRRGVFAHFIGVSDNGLAALSPTAWIFLRQRKLMGMEDDTVSTCLDLSLPSLFISLISVWFSLFGYIHGQPSGTASASGASSVLCLSFSLRAWLSLVMLPFSSSALPFRLVFPSVHSPLYILSFPCLPSLSPLWQFRILFRYAVRFRHHRNCYLPSFRHPTLSSLSLLAVSSPYFLFRCGNYFSFANLAPASFGKYQSAELPIPSQN